ncbi:MAG TPA: 8-oxo-dGTP diphosphatase [Armatimonadaceae bacterium]|nr:8-oxo-dGTP diphosphatase [Armatimonadaceae bacterium]
MPSPVYTPILATLGYVLSPDRERVLLIHRNTRPDDPAYGKYNGLGGKLDAGEDVACGMRRELREEAGIEAAAMTLRGTVSWPGFGKHGEDWFGFLFVVTSFAGEPLAGNHEGTLSWEPLARLLAFDLDLWAGDRHFLPLVFDDDPRPFHGVMPYAGGRPLSWSVTRL